MYTSISISNQNYKCTAINLLKVKPLELPSLEPDWEKFLIRDTETINKSMKNKLQKSHRQLIRSFKKQSKILDEERVARNNTVRQKRKDNLKAANQFTEETNLEYKKLVTAQAKRRHKIKHKK